MLYIGVNSVRIFFADFQADLLNKYCPVFASFSDPKYGGLLQPLDTELLVQEQLTCNVSTGMRDDNTIKLPNPVGDQDWQEIH